MAAMVYDNTIAVTGAVNLKTNPEGDTSARILAARFSVGDGARFQFGQFRSIPSYGEPRQ